MLDLADTVGYLTLEFTGPNIYSEKNEAKYGKITYSGRRSGRKIEDLRVDEEVKEKIKRAFESRGITKMHGIINVNLINDPKLKYDNQLSFGINFRANKIYLFSGATEAGYTFLIDQIYRIWKGVKVEQRAMPTLLDFLA